MRDFAAALEYFQRANDFAGPDEVTSFVLLRLGQCCRRLGDAKNAAAYLRRAYLLDGEDIFENDPEDLAFLKKTASV